MAAKKKAAPKKAAAKKPAKKAAPKKAAAKKAAPKAGKMGGKGGRTTMRSSKGTKLYAVRTKDGKFKDIQTYKRAHAADMRQKSKSEEE
ncbi:MAG: hypothetical protein HMLKMBBP_00402 [Planctomycetes bacterium]|nr:hypothetical protein [Planctomycetota bacterium]